MALTSYMGPVFSEMNAGLRGDEDKWNETQHVVYNAASALTTLSSLVYKGKVYRSEQTRSTKLPKLIETYGVGNFVVETPFLSTTTNENLRFAESDISEGYILLRYVIESKSGVEVSDFSPTKSEDEVLFSPGTVFKVTSFAQSKEDIVTDKDTGKIFKADTLTIGLEEVDLK